MIQKSRLLILSAWLCLALSPTVSSFAAPIIGSGRVIDGDSIEVANKRIRLYGIDAPEIEQFSNNEGVALECGKMASRFLENMIHDKKIHCVTLGTDRYRRIIAVCRLQIKDGNSINRIMVKQGWALAYRKFSSAYIDTEMEARQAQRGIWASRFVKPWDWRRGMRAANDARTQRHSCRIKGNIGRSGRIYHMPGGSNYSQIKINIRKGEKWFCSESEAVAAGWRRPKQ